MSTKNIKSKPTISNTCEDDINCKVITQPFENTNILEIKNLTIYSTSRSNEQKCIMSNEVLQKIIYNDGPVTAGIVMKNWSDGNDGTSWCNSGDNLIAKSNDIDKPNKDKPADHCIVIVGWGVAKKQDTKYWIIKNSWGSNWAYKGFTAIQFGKCADDVFGVIGHIDRDSLNTQDTTIQENIKDIKGSYASELKFKNEDDKFKFGVKKNLPKASMFDKINIGGLLHSADKSNNLAKSTNNIANYEDIDNKYKDFFCWATRDNQTGHSISGPVQQQGLCNSCWIFGCLDILSSAMAWMEWNKSTNKKVPKLIPLSIQKFIQLTAKWDCSTGADLNQFNIQCKAEPLFYYANANCQYFEEKPFGCIKNKEGKFDCQYTNRLCWNGKDSDKPTIQENITAEKNTEITYNGNTLSGDLGNQMSNRQQRSRWAPGTIICLSLSLVSFILFAKHLINYNNGNKINYNYLLGIVFSFIICILLFVFLVTRTI